jgi:hypothetical protein
MLDLFAGGKFFFACQSQKKITKFYIFFVDFGGAGIVFLYNGMVAKKIFLDRFLL